VATAGEAVAEVWLFEVWLQVRVPHRTVKARESQRHLRRDSVSAGGGVSDSVPAGILDCDFGWLSSWSEDEDPLVPLPG